MRIWRMQLLEEDVLLLKYSSEDVANQTHSDPNSKMCLFVFFNYVSILYTLAYTCLHLPYLFSSIMLVFSIHLPTPAYICLLHLLHLHTYL